MVTHTLDALEIPLDGGRVLRVGLYRTPDGEPYTLHLWTGFPDGAPWAPTLTGEALTVPADVLADLRGALAELEPRTRLKAS